MARTWFDVRSVTYLDPQAGCTIYEAAQNAVDYVQAIWKDHPTALLFNGFVMYVTKSSTMESINEDYNNQIDSRAHNGN